MDKILVNQKAASSKGYQALPSHHRPGSEPESGAEENILGKDSFPMPAYLFASMAKVVR